MMQAILPRSLRAQFTLALSMLSAFILAAGIAAIYALRSSEHATEQLAQDRLSRMQGAHDMVQRTLLIERETEQLLSSHASPIERPTYSALVDETFKLETTLEELSNLYEDSTVLDLEQASRLFRKTARVTAHLHEDTDATQRLMTVMMVDRRAALKAQGTPQAAALSQVLHRLEEAGTPSTIEHLRGEFIARASAIHELPQGLLTDLLLLRAMPPGPLDAQGDDLFSVRSRLMNQRATVISFHEDLKNQAQSLVAEARLQSAFFDGDFRVAVKNLVHTSVIHQRWVLMVLAGSLLFTWLVADVFLRRHVVRRLQQVSRYLQQQGRASIPLARLARERDEIGDMARAVDRFLDDRAQLVVRTGELSAAKERLVEEHRLLEMIASGTALGDILDRLTQLIEAQLDDIRCSVLLLDEKSACLHHGAAPSLPVDYFAAMDGLPVQPGAGSCGTAVHRRDMVVVSDIATDPLWTDHAALAAAHGLRACWSVPIVSHTGIVLGSFAMHAGSVRTPGDAELRLMALGSRIAGIAIERHRAEERIRHMAHHDELTGLPNRALLSDRITQALAQARRSDRSVALLYLDLDGFKFINDSYGHPIGDALLVAVAARLATVVRGGDSVARLGGDEFVIMLTDLDRAEDAVVIAQQVQSALSPALQIERRSLHVNCSIGISLYPQDGRTADTLLKNADVAMYRAKQKGRNGYQCYTDDMGLQARRHMELETALRQALEEQQFELYYQPQVDLATGRINSMEALIRWRHPDMGTVSPAVFIPFAEETGLILPIGEWVLRTACTQLKAWHQAGHDGLTVAVNLSARQFQGQDVVQLVRRVLADTGLEARYLELELTESALMLDTDTVLQTLNALKDLGVELALDDFGTGYSSLSHLRRFPIDVIKIDQSFTHDLATSTDTAAITRAILALARSLDVKTVAEGVETEQQLRFMLAHLCSSVQGYYFSSPVPVETMDVMLREDRRLTLPSRADAQLGVIRPIAAVG